MDGVDDSDDLFDLGDGSSEDAGAAIDEDDGMMANDPYTDSWQMHVTKDGGGEEELG